MSIVTSEESRKAYAERKNQVLELLLTAKDYYSKEERNDRADVFDKLYNDLLNGEFSIVVVGEFSAGKSTLLNALMGKRILPSFSNETTATVNFLRHSEKAANGEAGRVYYNNGDDESLQNATLATIEKYVSTKGEDVAKKIDHLDLYLDSEFLKDGVTLVDSPGLNGVADGHREITETQILKSHASIFLFNSDHPGSKTDFEFLHDLQSRVKTIIFVLNKIDEIKADEGETPESVIETLKKTYKEKFPEESTVPEIWPVAAYPALVARNDSPLEYHDKTNRTAEEKAKLENDSRLVKFEDRLMSFLTCGEKTKNQLLAPIDRVLSLAQETRDEYREEIYLLESATDTSEIDNQIAGIKETIEEIQTQITSTRQDVAVNVNTVLRDVREELSAQMSRLQNNRINEIDSFDDLEDLMGYLTTFEKSFKQRVSSIALTQEENLRDKILAVVKMQYTNQAGLIEQKLINENEEINLVVSNHLDTSERVFEVGLKEMDEKIKTLESQLSELQSEATDAEANYYEQRALERKRDEIKNDIKSLQDRKDTVEAQMLPPIERYTEEVHTKEHRDGILGTIGWLLFGGKNVTNHEMRTNSSAYDEAKKKQDATSASLEGKISQKTAELNSIGEVDSSFAEMQQIRKLAEVDAMRARLENVMKENAEKIDAKYKKEIKKIKRELTEYCDAITDELNNQVKKVLRASEQTYIEIVMDAVEGALKQSLLDKQTRLEQLEKQLLSSEEDRNLRIESLNEKINAINELIGKAVDMQVEIGNIQVDTIQQQNI
ncbi:dynamin family protein [Ruminococcus sp. 1001136sp1]|uniref:dynamin family protein n=1 Tax=Ruminococcus sp. 1001136sp1 TaxID=2986996 RepID=UPI00321C32D3